MSMKVYEFSFSSTKKFRVAEPYGGGSGTYITSYWTTGVNSYRFYYYKSLTGGKYIQEIWRQSNAGSWNVDSRSPSTTESAVPPYTVLSTEPRTVGWTGSSYEGGLPTTVTAIDFYTANITANAYGTVSRSKLFYDASALRSATATPTTGSSFLGWFLTGTETQVTTNDDFTVAANVITLKRTPTTADIDVEARFSAVYLLTVVGSANGTAYIGAAPSTATTGWYQVGSTVSIRATATNELYKFSKWTVGGADYSTSATVSVTTGSAAATYTAVFIPISYTLDVTPDDANKGSVAVFLAGSEQLTQTGLTVASLSSVEVRATPAFGYSFTGWYVGETQVSSAANYTFTMPEANYALEGRFASLPTAPLTVTKTKGTGSAAASAMGSLSLYHLESVQDTTSAVDTATLTANIFTTEQYKLVPVPANDTYQFDGWYQTVEGSEVAIVTGGIFLVSGLNLYITATTTSAIPVNAQFSERSLCTIFPVASDTSTYVEDNSAEDAGCTCAITAPAPDSTESGDKWLSGQTISMEATQATGWELRQWIVKLSASPYTVLLSLSKGDVGFGQTYSFNLTANSQVIARSVYTLPADQMQIQALHKTGQDTASGALEIHPCGDNYVELTNGVTAIVDDGSVCELTAIPANGYKFVNWRISAIDGTVVSPVPVYRFTVTASAVYYAEFAAATEQSLLLFEGAVSTMLASWRGRVNISNVPVNLSSARAYADGYPVAIDIGTGESPFSPLTEARIVRSIVNDQNSIRLPSRRREKYFMIGFEANAVVNEVTVATSMEGLKNGQV